MSKTTVLSLAITLVIATTAMAQDTEVVGDRLFSKLSDRVNRVDADVEALTGRWDRADKQLSELGPLKRQVETIKAERRGWLRELQEGRAEIIKAKAELKTAKAELASERAEMVGEFAELTDSVMRFVFAAVVLVVVVATAFKLWL